MPDYDYIEEYTWKGTGLKYAVNMTCEGFDMDTDDWTITVTRGNQSKEFTPENSIQEIIETPAQGGGTTTSTQWYICLDTDEFASGELYITFDACVPDSDFPSGIRHEIQEFLLTVLKKPKTKK